MTWRWIPLPWSHPNADPLADIRMAMVQEAEAITDREFAKRISLYTFWRELHERSPNLHRLRKDRDFLHDTFGVDVSWWVEREELRQSLCKPPDPFHGVGRPSRKKNL